MKKLKMAAYIMYVAVFLLLNSYICNFSKFSNARNILPLIPVRQQKGSENQLMLKCNPVIYETVLIAISDPEPDNALIIKHFIKCPDFIILITQSSIINEHIIIRNFALSGILSNSFFFVKFHISCLNIILSCILYKIAVSCH